MRQAEDGRAVCSTVRAANIDCPPTGWPESPWVVFKYREKSGASRLRPASASCSVRSRRRPGRDGNCKQTVEVSIELRVAYSCTDLAALRSDQPPSHRRDCHFADAPSTSLLIHLLKVEGAAAERQSRRRLQPPGTDARPATTCSQNGPRDLDSGMEVHRRQIEAKQRETAAMERRRAPAPACSSATSRSSLWKFCGGGREARPPSLLSTPATSSAAPAADDCCFDARHLAVDDTVILMHPRLP